MRYGTKPSKKLLKELRDSLKWLYNQIPETKGCLENISKPDGCGAWCCQEQWVSCWYVEFLNSWHHITHNWNDSQIVSLIEKCLRTYLFSTQNKGCVFWDKESKLCSQHATRPFNCFKYGIEPEEEFNERLVKLQVLYPEAKAQCNLVSTVSGEKVTKADMKKWWDRLLGFEVALGVSPKLLHDGHEGSYRTYHDHILLHLFDDDVMESLTELRLNADPMQKETAIRQVLASLRKFADSKRPYVGV